MKYFSLAHIAQPISTLALGTATRIFTPETQERAANLLDAFLDAGGNLVDTAHIYNLGASEKTLGLALDASGKRERVVLVTKGCHPAIDPNNIFGKPWLPRVTPKAIQTDLSESLERLQTDFIDLYLLHRDDETAPVGPIIDALNAEQARGRIRAFGASNWRTARIAEANAYAAQKHLNGFVISSSQFGLVQSVRSRFPGTIVLSETERAWHAANQFPLLAWSSLGAGYIARVAQGAGTNDIPDADAFSSAKNNARVRRAQELAARKNASAVQIALAYALHQNFPLATVVGPTDVAHLQELIAATGIALDANETTFLEQD